MRFSITTLGCKLNQAESGEIKKELEKLGHLCVPFSAPADLAIIRACAVTQNASQTAREKIRQAKHRGAFVIAGGCLENRDLPEIDCIAQTAGDIIKAVKSKGIPLKTNPTSPIDHLDKIKNRTRALIKIQNGCNFNCAYCVIPDYRGKSKSLSIKKIIEKIKEAEKNNHKEIILTGVNICQYNDRGKTLADLLQTILLKTKIERIRLGSLDPRLINEKLIELFNHPRLLPHWHLSLQSGSDKILKAMNRGYDTKKYLEIVKKIRTRNPLFSFTTDIIAGFPDETKKDFQETCDFVKKIGFAKIHVFPYSPRPGTLAAAMKQIQDKIKNERTKKLIKISEQIGKKFTNKFKGKKRSVLFEQKKNGYWLGYTPEYLPFKYQTKENLKNVILEVKL